MGVISTHPADPLTLRGLRGRGDGVSVCVRVCVSACVCVCAPRVPLTRILHSATRVVLRFANCVCLRGCVGVFVCTNACICGGVLRAVPALCTKFV